MTRTNTILVIILCCAFAIRIALFGVLAITKDASAFLLPDSYGYTGIAQNIYAGNGFSMATTTPYLPDSIRTPVVPYLLAGMPVYAGVPYLYLLLQICAGTALVFVTFHIARGVSKNNSIALGAATLMAIEPYSVFINVSVLTETIFALTVGIIFLALIRYVETGRMRMLAIASALCAFAALTRPIGQFLPLILLAVVVFREHPRAYLKGVALSLIPFLFVASPWIVRNYVTFSIPGFSSGGFQNAYSDLGATVLSYRDGTSFPDAKRAIEADFAKRHNIPVSKIQQDLSLSPILFGEALSLLAHNPVQTLQAFLTVSIGFFTNDAWTYYLQKWALIPHFTFGVSPTHVLLSEGPIAAFRESVSAANGAILVPVFGRIFWVVTSLLWFVGIVILAVKGGTARVYAAMMFMFIAYLLLLSFSNGAGINGRFRYPVNSLMFAGASIGAWYVWQRSITALRRYEIFNRYTRVLRGR